MNPVTHAQNLAKMHGLKKAYEMAVLIVRDSETAGNDGAPFAEEVELVEQTTKGQDGKLTTRTVTVIDEKQKAKRLANTLVFWKNVKSYLKKRQPVETT